jgi:ATP-binding cassette subfamily B protein
MVLKSFWQLIRPYWRWVIVIFVALAIQTAFRVAVPVGFQLIFDRAIAFNDLAFLRDLLIFFLLFWLVQSGASGLQDYYSAKSGVLAVNHLRLSMFQRLGWLSHDDLAWASSGDVISRFSSDLASIELALVQSFYGFLYSLLNLIVSGLVLFYWDWRLATFTLLGMLSTMVVPKLFAPGAKHASLARKDYEGKITSMVQESLSNHEVIHAFNLQTARDQAFQRLQHSFRKRAMNSHLMSALVRRTGSQGAYLVQILIIILGGFLTITGGLTVGILVGFSTLLQNMVGAINHLTAAIPNLVQAAAGIHRVNAFLGPKPPLQDVRPPLSRLTQAIQLQDVSFGYRPDRPVLKHLDLTLPIGQSIALVGPSGSGKSSILKLLAGFYTPQTGQITLDGCDLQQVSASSWRRQLGLVAQDCILFADNFRENIRIGNLEATDDAVYAAAKAAEIHDWILDQPQGYDTFVGEGGRHLSGGQRQRIAIARVMLRNSALLLLDEATSALDVATERAICSTLKRLGKERTMVSVTHRLHTIVDYDQIIVMQDGQWVEQGSHEQLLSQGGLYRQLWDKQSGLTISDDSYSATCSVESLAMIPLFASLEPSHLQAVAEALVSEFFPRDRLLFAAGDYGDKFYIIAQGSVEVVVPGCHPGDPRNPNLHDGDFFGEMALLSNERRSATLYTRVPTLLLTLTRHQFYHLLENSPAILKTVERAAQDRNAADRRLRL